MHTEKELDLRAVKSHLLLCSKKSRLFYPFPKNMTTSDATQPQIEKSTNFTHLWHWRTLSCLCRALCLAEASLSPAESWASQRHQSKPGSYNPQPRCSPNKTMNQEAGASNFPLTHPLTLSIVCIKQHEGKDFFRAVLDFFPPWIIADKISNLDCKSNRGKKYFHFFIAWKFLVILRFLNFIKIAFTIFVPKKFNIGLMDSHWCLWLEEIKS